jgi:hypothetical protein
MARKLKVYQTALGFFDQAIAAPSMKAAPEAWGANSNLFHLGAARESDDPEIRRGDQGETGRRSQACGRLERAHGLGWRECSRQTKKARCETEKTAARKDR